MLFSMMLCGQWLPLALMSLHAQGGFVNHPSRDAIISWLKLSDKSSPEEMFFRNRLGPEAVPTLKEVLSNRKQFSGFVIRNALGLAGTPWVNYGKEAKQLLPVIQPYLLDDDPRYRSPAVRAIGHVGGTDQAPVLINFLYDPDYGVRAAAIETLGKVGMESALISLNIWRVRTQQSDKARPLTEKWLTASEVKYLDEAIVDIKKRLQTLKDAN